MRAITPPIWTVLGIAFVLLAALPVAVLSAEDLTAPLADVTDRDTNNGPAVVASLASPRNAVRRFYEAMDGNFFNDPVRWRQAISLLQFPVDADVSDMRRQQAALQLYGILTRIPLDWLSIPDAQAVAAANLQSYSLFPRADVQADQDLVHELGKDITPVRLTVNRAGEWRFAAATVTQLPEIYAAMEPLPLQRGRAAVTITQLLEQYLPPWLLHGQMMGVEYWKWLALLTAIFLGLLLDFAIRLFLKAQTIRQATKRGLEPPDPETLKRSVRPFGLAAMAILWLIGIRIIGLSGLAFVILNGALQVFVILAVVLAAWRLTDIFTDILARRAAKTRTRVDNVLVPLLRKAVKVFVLIFGVIYAANALEINIWPLLASLSIGAVAFGFAAKDTVENFFGSVAVLLDRPFDVGDWVVIDKHEGMVEEIGFRSTRVRTFYNSLISIPNANLVRAVVDNYGRRKFRRWSTRLGVQYDTSPEKLVAFCEGMRELIRLHPYTRKDFYFVHCNEFGDFSLQIMLYVFFAVPDWNTELRERDRLFRDIVRLADQLGVQFAFPTQTVHLYKEEYPPADQSYQPADVPPQQNTERRAAISGIRAAKAITAQQPDIHKKPGPATVQGAPSNIELDDAGNPVPEPIEPNAAPTPPPTIRPES